MPPIYDKFASSYDRVFAPLESIGLSRYRAETLSLVPSDSVILELGAGTGANFRLYPESKHAVSTELSIKMLEIAASKVKFNQLVQADAQDLPFIENVFDAAFATLVFCSIPDPDRAFQELRRVVKPGGKIVLLEHVRPNGLLGYLFDLLNIFSVALGDDHFNRRTVKLAEDSGLKVSEVRVKMFGIVNLIICEALSSDETLDSRYQ